MKTLIKGLAIFAAYIALTIAFMGIIDFFVESATGFEFSNTLVIFIGLLAGLVMVASTISKLIIEVKGNDVLLTVDVLFPNEDDKGNTIFNAYPTGIHFLWPWESRKTTINLEADIAEKDSVKTSTKDDDVIIDFQYDVEPDSKNLSLYLLNGKDEKERESNLKKRCSTLLKRTIEKFATGHESDVIVKGEKSQDLQDKLDEVLETEAKELGVRVRKVRIGNIDYSKAVSNARNDRKTIEERAKALKKLTDEGLSIPEAIQFLQAETGKSKRVDWNINTPPTLTSFSTVGTPGT
jgi:regulator of protease activity HflC (stomatin/prohibitin superfamily)